MSVNQLLKSMSSKELTEWIAYYRIRKVEFDQRQRESELRSRNAGKKR